MTELQELLSDLVERGWTKQATADAMGVTWPTMWRWATGRMVPAHERGVILALRQLARTKPPSPKPRGRKPGIGTGRSTG